MNNVILAAELAAAGISLKSTLQYVRWIHKGEITFDTVDFYKKLNPGRIEWEQLELIVPAYDAKETGVVEGIEIHYTNLEAIESAKNNQIQNGPGQNGK